MKYKKYIYTIAAHIFGNRVGGRIEIPANTFGEACDKLRHEYATNVKPVLVERVQNPEPCVPTPRTKPRIRNMWHNKPEFAYRKDIRKFVFIPL